MTTLTGKTVLLTGASRGLGVYIARALAKEQATVVCVSRSQSGLAQTCNVVKAAGGKAIAIPFDVRNISQLSALVQQAQDIVGPIDVLINNAGIEINAAFANYSLAEIQSIFNTNLLAVMELTRLLLPSMMERGSGRIVNIASLAGKKGVAFNSVYSASKAGLIMWTDAMRQELVGTGVNISVVCPGYVSQTGMTVDTRVSAPKLAGISTPKSVANAVVKAIKKKTSEVVVNQNPITESLTKFMLAIGQISPTSVDRIYRWLGVVDFNQKRAENRVKDGYVAVESHRS
ncbi:Short-chain dehydrogenase/reductase SDR [Trichormus variabilis ATCC 29413]|uniref:Short-chain dehydrogenase/reductase SDR n=2 Tax=Anabaena variabilis TaxID=264691 RepID=Q3M9X5_TRIV2|nr:MULTISPECIES: SDR family NAD(P)-dependent oxidoreductase [Nostocaceae]ABA22211.1 Short-chain dehydrogenase/reductase SDR [Trichormus variabilis ATCC 29413]MBC1217663.1 SDR family NAD(P)-dependent oxidoreductase [Trichormus variabilis ARAD]MBC1254332.1 SDR family NAD(P)-dependent oxidoreductase [Trichormus variabilis V5]MBC1268046.1 SDR family NAD(P)-dependent oxidoreductase [Trichormus variabilis FSR]MBC1301248.1 SDR family NAD(P)-dependent oxidoreductase [Trichormus variabilis N2B]